MTSLPPITKAFGTPGSGEEIIAVLNQLQSKTVPEFNQALALSAFGISYAWADATERAAQTGMTEGKQGFQQDTYEVYKYESSTWVFFYKVYDIQAPTTITSSTTVSNVLAPGAVKTINANMAAGTVTITDGFEIGTKILIRKINETQGAVTISFSGTEVCTRKSKTSIALNQNGDFWEIEKVTSTRWEIVRGHETGSNANGTYIKRADLSQLIDRYLPSFQPSTMAGVAFDLPSTFSDSNNSGSISFYGTTNSNADQFTSYSIGVGSATYKIHTIRTDTYTIPVHISAQGEW